MKSGREQTCGVFGTCGGCSLLNVPYLGQLEQKDSRIAQLFDGLCDEGALRPILGMDYPFHYRNKVIAPFVPARRSRGGKGGGPKDGQASGQSGRARRKSRDGAKKAPGRVAVLSGMYAKGTHRVVEAPGGCLLENRTAIAVVDAVKAIMTRHGIAPYDEDTGTGFLRHAVVRVGHHSDEVLAVLVTNADEFPYAKSFCRELVRRVPAVTTVVQSVNTRQTNVVLGERERTLWGPGFILDELCGLSFRISAHSFYQVNASQTEALYETAIELARLGGDETVIDAYCGTGTIGLVAASRGADRVVGVDSVEAAVRDARQNARHNGIENARFVAADATAFMKQLAVQGLDGGEAERAAGTAAEGAAGSIAGSSQQPLVLFMDPPRAGATPEFLEAARALTPARIVYVSCNPETQVRDLRPLLSAGYAIDAVQPVDMFPHTPHIECVCSLSR